MWREESGIIEMLFAYIGEYVEFGGWQSWRNVVEEIISCHERYRQEKLSLTVEPLAAPAALPKSTEVTLPEHCAGTWQSSQLEDEAAMEGGLRLSSDVESSLPEAFLGEHWKDSAEALHCPNSDMDDATEQVKMESMVASSCYSPSGRSAGTDNRREIGVTSGRSGGGDLSCYPNSSSTPSSAHLAHSFPRQERPLICQICDRRFSFQSALRRHLHLHVGQRQYHCEECGKSFFQSGNLKRHMLTHGDRQTVSCQLCHKSFRQMRSLLNHQKKTHVLT